jgi:hypothetical protein
MVGRDDRWKRRERERGERERERGIPHRCHGYKAKPPPKHQTPNEARSDGVGDGDGGCGCGERRTTAANGGALGGRESTAKAESG